MPPSHEGVQTARRLDHLRPGPQVEVVGVAEDQVDPDLFQVPVRMALTVALVPTGMKQGVDTVPWFRASEPVRARHARVLPGDGE